MGKWTREKHEEVKARHADQGERGIDAQQVWDDLGEALVEIERGWAEIERLTELVAPVEAWAQRAADVVCAVPIDDLVRAGLASEDPAVTFEELEADHDLGSLRAAHERARAVILRAIAVESVPAPSAPAEMLAAQPSPEKDNQIKRLATLSVALISARAANTRLERAMQRRVASRDELISKTTGAPAIVVEPTEAEIAAERDRLLDTYGRARTTLPGLRGDAAGWLAVAEASLARARCPTPLTEAEAHRWGTKIIGDGSCGVRALAVFVGDALRALERGEIPPEVRPSKPSGEPGAKCSAFADGTWEADVGGIMLDPALTRHGDPHEAEWETRSWTPKPGDCVRTAEKLTACDSYALEARAKRRANASGKVIRAGDPGHGLYFDVRHDDGTKAPYDIDELRPDIDERLCVSVLVTNIDGHVALIESAKPGRGWELPGGGVKPGETPLAAALREVAEEIGVQLVEDALEPAGILRGTPKPGAEFTSVIHVFRARAEGKLRAGSDARKARWWAGGEALLIDRCGKLSDLASRDVLLAWAREEVSNAINQLSNGGGQ